MANEIRVVMAQLNPLVGDVEGNAAAVVESAARARDELGGDVVVFPELMLTGYPPDDLLLRDDFMDSVERTLESLRERIHGIAVVLGTPLRSPAGLRNAAVVFADGAEQGRYFKQQLPTYGVFDDKRYFTPGDTSLVVEIRGCRIGVTVCEDLWHPGPAAAAHRAGAELLININASPFDRHKWRAREQVLRARLAEAPVPLVYVNMSGGHDEVVYDGGSCAFNRDGELTVRAPQFELGLYPVTLQAGDGGWRSRAGTIAAELDAEASVYEALVWGVRDYIDKNGFPGALIGLSGGMDSALTAAIAVDALGPDRVHTIMMPTRYTSELSHTDATAVAENLGIRYDVVAIEDIFEAFRGALGPLFEGRPEDITEENLQSRTRGTLLMAVSNKFGKLVLATGNKSEMAVGYATLYGDMVGGFSPLKDVLKTEVYDLARYRNTLGAVIPESIFTKAPTAELRPDQKDSDSLPEYHVLDAIIEAYVEKDQSVASIVSEGYDAGDVERVIRMIHKNEYKRRQAPPGVKVTARAFGRDRRYPITSGFGRG
ncbi:NAD+ synthase [Ectothiorhodospiraceae bacterium WFHF3C12]|nr:NAD+ synthase [Ectothiorhodospiraceae bacterium WFHF3C12]